MLIFKPEQIMFNAFKISLFVHTDLLLDCASFIISWHVVAEIFLLFLKKKICANITFCAWVLA